MVNCFVRTLSFPSELGAFASWRLIPAVSGEGATGKFAQPRRLSTILMQLAQSIRGLATFFHAVQKKVACPLFPILTTHFIRNWRFGFSAFEIYSSSSLFRISIFGFAVFYSLSSDLDARFSVPRHSIFNTAAGSQWECEQQAGCDAKNPLYSK